MFLSPAAFKKVIFFAPSFPICAVRGLIIQSVAGRTEGSQPGLKQAEKCNYALLTIDVWPSGDRSHASSICAHLLVQEIHFPVMGREKNNARKE